MEIKCYKLIILFFFLVCFNSCSLLDVKYETPEQIIARATQQKIFFAPYDEIWRAAHVILKYTIASENQDFGLIETDYVKSIDGWIPPYKDRPQYPSSRYKIIMNFAKGQKINGQESVRVTIEKKIEVFKDFISEVKIVDSDGLEEKSIFYRIEREISISKALANAAKSDK